MTDEAPVHKPVAKLNPNYKPFMRPTSSGYTYTEVDPEKQRNIPSHQIESTNKKGNSLNINAVPFTPKNKISPNSNQPDAKKPSEGPYVKKVNGGFNSKKNYGQQQTFFNNINNINNNSYVPPYNYSYNNSQGYMPAQTQNSYPQHFYPQNPMYMNGQIPMNPSYNPNYYNMNNNNYGGGGYQQNIQYQQNVGSAPGPIQNSNQPKQPVNKQVTQLKNAQPYIPKSMRESTNKPNNEEKVNLNLNLDAKSYFPQNENLKKNEEQIRKKKENEKLKKENKDKTNEEIKKEETKKEENKKEEEKKEADKNQEKIEEQNGKPKEEVEQKKKSKLFQLFEDKPQEPKKTKEKPKNVQTEAPAPASNYGRNKKKNILDKKLNDFNMKDKKIKEIENKQKKKKEEEDKEKKKQKEEEDRQKKKQKEEERQRKEKEAEEQKEMKEEEEEEEEEEEKKEKEEEEEKKNNDKEKTKKEEEEKKKKDEEDEKNKVFEKKYFFVFKNKNSEKKEYKYTFEYIMQFKDWKMSNQEDLLTKEVLDHFENFKEEEREGGGGKKKKRDDGKPYYKSNQMSSKGINNFKTQNTKEAPNSTPAPTQENSMEQWARKDLTKEIKAAEEFKQKLEETIKDDPIKRNLRGFLNMLTKDNYEETKAQILGVIKDNVDYQVKFLDVLFQKAVLERAYVELYAKLCKELDKELPQKNPPKESKAKDGDKKPKQNSVMRGKLLDKCREIFQIKNNEKFDEYIKEKDPVERENKLKKFVLGNVYFITELIKIKILSKKIAPVCIKNLFERYENIKNDEKLRLINIEAIVIFTDQFGSLVHSQGKKIDSKDAKAFKDSIDEIFQKLDKIKDEPTLPGFIKYKIINLIEKRKNNYQKTKYEEYIIAKSKKEVEKEMENQDQITQDTVNDTMKKGLTDYRDFVEEEGSSEKYEWKETTYLYEKKGKGLDDILEGYISGCSFFIEKESNVKYAKDYIKELIDYYESQITKKAKRELKTRLLNMLEPVREIALDTPVIYDIYAYIIYIFLSYNIMEIKDLEDIIIEKDSTQEDYSAISSILEKTNNYYDNEEFKEELTSFEYVKKNQDLFKWVYSHDEKNKEEEENDEE